MDAPYGGPLSSSKAFRPVHWAHLLWRSSKTGYLSWLFPATMFVRIACAHAASVAQGESVSVLPARHKSKSCRQGAGITSALSAYISLNELLSRARRPPTTTRGEKAVCVRNLTKSSDSSITSRVWGRLNWRGSPPQELAPFDAAPSLPPLAQVLRSGTGAKKLHHWRECRDHRRLL